MGDYDYPKICPCCKEDIIKDIHYICHTCGWEDDWVQNDDPDFWGGANDDSLNDHRKKFLELRKKDPKYKWIDHLK